MSKTAKAPLHATLKAVPKFASEAAERAYWESHDSSDLLDWSQAQTDFALNRCLDHLDRGQCGILQP